MHRSDEPRGGTSDHGQGGHELLSEDEADDEEEGEDDDGSLFVVVVVVIILDVGWVIGQGSKNEIEG